MLSNLFSKRGAARSSMSLKAMCLLALSQAVKPREKLNTSQWAAKRRKLGLDESSHPGKWRNDLAPYLTVIMNAMGDNDVDLVALMKCAQAGGSEVLRNTLGYWAEHDPGPCMWVMPDQKSAEEQVDERLKPMIKNSIPEYQTSNRHDLSYKSLKLTSMTVYPAWAGSPQALASRPCRYAILDELDKFPRFSGKDAAPVALAKARTRTYEHRKKVIMISTPTTKEAPINTEFENCADQREYHVPCPYCNEFQLLKWSGVVWPKREEGKSRIVHAEFISDRQLARYKCEHCEEEFGERERKRIIKKGQWVSSLGLAEDCFSRKIAFRFNSLVNPFSNLSDLVEKWLKAQDDPGDLMEFTNQELGEPWEHQITSADKEQIERKAEAGYEKGVVPPWASMILTTADTQKNGFWYTLRAWGRDYKSRGLTEGFARSFDELYRIGLESHWPIENKAGINMTMTPDLLLIDSGGGIWIEDEDASTTDLVYQFAERDPARIIPVKGYGGKKKPAKRISENKIRSSDSRRKGRKFGEVILRVLDTQTYKDILNYRILSENPVMWEEHGEIELDYCKQMASERKVFIREGQSGYVAWQPYSKNTANHYWDCSVYQCAGADMVQCHTFPSEEELSSERERLYQKRQQRRGRSKPSRFSNPHGQKWLSNRR